MRTLDTNVLRRCRAMLGAKKTASGRLVDRLFKGEFGTVKRQASLRPVTRNSLGGTTIGKMLLSCRLWLRADQASEVQAKANGQVFRSAGLSAATINAWAKIRLVGASKNCMLQCMGVYGHDVPYDKELVTWSISAPQNADLPKAGQMGFLPLLSLSWVWSAMHSLRTWFGRRMVTAPLCPNRKSRKPQSNTTHVTLSLRGGCNFAAAFCARGVRSSYISSSEVPAC